MGRRGEVMMLMMSNKSNPFMSARAEDKTLATDLKALGAARDAVVTTRVFVHPILLRVPARHASIKSRDRSALEVLL